MNPPRIITTAQNGNKDIAGQIHVSAEASTGRLTEEGQDRTKKYGAGGRQDHPDMKANYP